MREGEGGSDRALSDAGGGGGRGGTVDGAPAPTQRADAALNGRGGGARRWARGGGGRARGHGAEPGHDLPGGTGSGRGGRGHPAGGGAAARGRPPTVRGSRPQARAGPGPLGATRHARGPRIPLVVDRQECRRAGPRANRRGPSRQPHHRGRAPQGPGLSAPGESEAARRHPASRPGRPAPAHCHPDDVAAGRRARDLRGRQETGIGRRLHEPRPGRASRRPARGRPGP